MGEQLWHLPDVSFAISLETHAFGGLRSDARSRELVHPALRDETNAMAATRTPEKYPEVSENCPSGIRKVHPKIGYLRVTDCTITVL